MKRIFGFGQFLLLAHCLFQFSTFSAAGYQLDGNQKLGVYFSISWNIDALSKSITWTVTRNTPIKSLPRRHWSQNINEKNFTREELSELFVKNVPPYWFSLALNSRGQKITMKKSDFLFVWNKGKGFECEISDRYSHTSSSPVEDTQLGGKSDLTFIGADILFQTNSSVLQSSCTFSRLLNTGDKYDIPIKEHQFIIFGWAWGQLNDDGTPAQHKGTVEYRIINMFTGELINPDLPRYKDMLFWHGVLLTLAWFVLMIPATFLARYLKTVVPTWYFIHWKVQVFALFLAIVGIFLAAKELEWTVPENDIHVIIGFTILGMFFLQLVLGYFSNALWYEGKMPRWWPDKLHWWVGRLILLAGIVNIVFGLISLEDKDILHRGIGWSWPFTLYYAYVGLLFVTFIVYEIRVGQQHEHEIICTDEKSTDYEDEDEDDVDEATTADDDSGNLLLYGKSPYWARGIIYMFSMISLVVCVITVGGFVITLYFA